MSFRPDFSPELVGEGPGTPRLVCDQSCFERMGLAMSFFDVELSALRSVVSQNVAQKTYFISIYHEQMPEHGLKLPCEPIVSLCFPI